MLAILLPLACVLIRVLLVVQDSMPATLSIFKLPDVARLIKTSLMITKAMHESIFELAFVPYVMLSKLHIQCAISVVLSVHKVSNVVL